MITNCMFSYPNLNLYYPFRLSQALSRFFFIFCYYYYYYYYCYYWYANSVAWYTELLSNSTIREEPITACNWHIHINNHLFIVKRAFVHYLLTAWFVTNIFWVVWTDEIVHEVHVLRMTTTQEANIFASTRYFTVRIGAAYINDTHANIDTR